MLSELCEDFCADVGVFGMKQWGNVIVVVKGVDFKPII